MTKHKAERLTDVELSEEIAALESGRKLRHFLMSPVMVNVLKREQADRQKRAELTVRDFCSAV